MMDIALKLIDESEVRLKGSRIPATQRFRFQSSNGDTYLEIEVLGGKASILSRHPDVADSEEELSQKIEEWLVDENPDKQFGTDDTETDVVDLENPYDPDKIRVDTKPFSLRQVYDMIKAGDIDLTPDFQRNLVWDNTRKSRLIESILLRIPLPMFYFAQDDEGRISVVDGLQRLSTIREFMDNEFKLRNLEYLDANCSGKLYRSSDRTKSIDAKYFRWFNMTQITVHVIDPSSPFKLKYDIFKRINTGGQPLNSQEIRNCLASAALRRLLRELAASEVFKDATGWSVKDVRMDAQELVLRFILFHKKYRDDTTLANYSGNIETELNNLTEELSKDKREAYGSYRQVFENAMKNAFYLFGDYSFRKCRVEHLAPNSKRQLINRALFVSWSVLLSAHSHEQVVSQNAAGCLARPLAERIDSDPEFFNFLTYSTNSRTNVQASFEAAEEIIRHNLVH
jgi:hypothetical protein